MDPDVQTNLTSAMPFVNGMRFGVMDLTADKWDYVGVRFQNPRGAMYTDLMDGPSGKRAVFRGTDLRGYLAHRVVEPYFAAQSHYQIGGDVGNVVATLLDDQCGVGAIPTARRFSNVTFTVLESFAGSTSVNSRFRYSNLLDSVRSLLDQHLQQDGEYTWLETRLGTNASTGDFDGWTCGVSRYGTTTAHKLFPSMGDVSERAQLASVRQQTWAYVLGDGSGHTRTLRENSDASVSPTVSGWERLEHVLDLGQSGATTTEIDGIVKGLYDPGFEAELVTPGPDAPNMNVGDTVQYPAQDGSLITHRVTEKLTTIENGKVLRQYQLSGGGNSDPLLSNPITLPDYD